ncbi:MAG: hypothetical protein CVT90_02045, partial [Candidatus Altiarchaeales archaeon HGW-Altiarchaeales-3]
MNTATQTKNAGKNKQTLTTNTTLMGLIGLIGILLIISITGCMDGQLNPDEVKAKVLEVAGSIETYKMDMDMNMTMRAEGMEMVIPITAKVVADEKNKKMEMKMSMSMMGQKMDMIIYILGNTMYMQSPDPFSGESQWIRMDAEDIGGTDDMWSANSQVEKELELLKDAKVEFLGEESVRGVSSWKVKVTPDEKTLEEYIKKEMSKTESSSSSGLDDMEIKFKNYTVTYWIARDTYFITKEKVHADMAMKVEGFTGMTEMDMAMDMDAELYDYNVAVDISLPGEAMNAKTMDELME